MLIKLLIFIILIIFCASFFANAQLQCFVNEGGYRLVLTACPPPPNKETEWPVCIKSVSMEMVNSDETLPVVNRGCGRCPKRYTESFVGCFECTTNYCNAADSFHENYFVKLVKLVPLMFVLLRSIIY